MAQEHGWRRRDFEKRYVNIWFPISRHFWWPVAVTVAVTVDVTIAVTVAVVVFFNPGRRRGEGIREEEDDKNENVAAADDDAAAATSTKKLSSLRGSEEEISGVDFLDI